MILIDAGPLIAIIDRNDQHHFRCKNIFQNITGELGTVWPAITEAMYLLGQFDAQAHLWELLVKRAVTLLPLSETDFVRMRELMHQYRDLPMDLADAALVCVGERERIRTVFTTDEKDFRTYRPRGLGHFLVLDDPLRRRGRRTPRRK